MKSLTIMDLGVTSYEDAYFLQKKIAGSIRENAADDTLMLLEHPNVFTIGRSGSRENILDKELFDKEGFKVVHIDRGGDITFHGRGQLVAYPVFDLKRHGKDIRLFIQNLERVLGLTIEAYGLKADKKKQSTGLWTGGYKIGFIGIGISNWISYHGLSINANVDLKYFSAIRPCGIDSLKVNSLEKMLGRHINMDALKGLVAEKCCEVFGFERILGNTENAFMAAETAS